MKGLRDSGVNVIRLGLLPTPVVSFAVIKLKADFGVAVSASHNPGRYNGFKIIDRRANQIGLGQGLERVKEILERDKGYQGGKRNKGIVRQMNVVPDYVRYLTKKFKSQIRPLRAAVDYGNGTGAVTAGRIFRALAIKVKPLFAKPDGRFPRHEPNSQDPKNFRWLRAELRAGAYDLGVFFDGDADRAVFFDHRGQFIRPDITAGIFALDILRRHPGAEIYHDPVFSRAVIEEIRRAGGRPKTLPVGSSHFKPKIPEEKNAWLGAELSGHTMFRDFWGIDDGLYTALKLMAIMSKTRKPLAVLALPFRRYAQSGEIRIKAKQPGRLIRRVAKHFRGGKRSRLDGLTIEYPEWWFNIRPSHTEPVIRLNVEAETASVLRAKVRPLEELLRAP